MSEKKTIQEAFDDLSQALSDSWEEVSKPLHRLVDVFSRWFS